MVVGGGGEAGAVVVVDLRARQFSVEPVQLGKGILLDAPHVTHVAVVKVS